MTQIVAQIVGHEAKPAGTGIVHTFNLADGKVLKTWKQDIADQAVPFVGGAAVTIEMETVTQNKNGRVFTDNYINGIVNGAGQSGGTEVAATPASELAGTEDLFNAILALTAAIETLTEQIVAANAEA